MTAVVAVAAGLAVFLSGASRRPSRLILVLPRSDPVGSKGTPDARSPWRIPIAVVLLVGAVAFVGGITGAAGGIVMAVAVAGVPPRRRAAVVPADDVPIVVDLVAGCLDAGATLPDALDAAAAASAGLLSDRCHAVAGGLRAGLTGREAWQAWFDDPSLAAFARTAARTAHTGAAAADDFRRTSSRLRARRRAAAHHRVQQASVWLVVPLGLCFLPAFVLLSVVPIVVGLFPSLRL